MEVGGRVEIYTEQISMTELLRTSDVPETPVLDGESEMFESEHKETEVMPSHIVGRDIEFEDDESSVAEEEEKIHNMTQGGIEIKGLYEWDKEMMDEINSNFDQKQSVLDQD